MSQLDAVPSGGRRGAARGIASAILEPDLPLVGGEARAPDHDEDGRRISFIRALDRLAAHRKAVPGYRPGTVHVGVTERYARRALRLGKDAPLAYRGFSLRCVGNEGGARE
jgi:hypothetical protein